MPQNTALSYAEMVKNTRKSTFRSFLKREQHLRSAQCDATKHVGEVIRYQLLGRLVYALEDVASAVTASLRLLRDMTLITVAVHRGEDHEDVAALLQQGNLTLHGRLLLVAALHSAADHGVHGLRAGSALHVALHWLRSSARVLIAPRWGCASASPSCLCRCAATRYSAPGSWSSCGQAGSARLCGL